MDGFRLPGVVWSALLVALPMLAVWLGDSFPNAVWAAPVAGLVLIAAKVVAVIAAGGGGNAPPGAEMAEGPARAGQSMWWG